MLFTRPRQSPKSSTGSAFGSATTADQRYRTALVGVFALILISGCVERTPSRSHRRRHRQLTEADKGVIRNNVLKAPPAKMSHPVSAHLEDKVIYLGMDVQGSFRKGKSIRLVHYWQVLKPMLGWRLFTHLNGPGGKVSFTNVDHVAIGGRYPVEKWKEKEIIRDAHTISVPANWPHESVEVYTGIWQPRKGRLKVKSGPSDGQGRVLAGRIVFTKAQAQPVSPRPAGQKSYKAHKAVGPIKIDGKADEEDWKRTKPGEEFVDTLKGQKPEQRTEAKILWDDKNLYLLVVCEDKDIWSTLKRHDGPLWTQEALTLLIDADGDGATYIELQLSPNGTVYDAYHPRVRQAQMGWESGAKVAVAVEGTLNKRDDIDTRWTVEISIPFSAINGSSDKKVTVPPKPGDKYRINIFRIDLPKGKARQASAWNAPLSSDFHTMSRLGTLVFDGPHAQKDPAAEAKDQAAGKKKDPAAGKAGPSGASGAEKKKKGPARPMSRKAGAAPRPRS